MAPKKLGTRDGRKKRLTFAESSEKEARAAVVTTGAAQDSPKRVHFAPAVSAAADRRGSGIVRAPAKPAKRARREEDEEDEDDSPLASEDDEESLENLSDIADDESADDEMDEDTNPFVRSRKANARLAYPALRLSFLPPQFEEPQLYKFLGQFGAEVLNCFCVRSRRTHQSKGIAYVQFDRPSILPTVVEECHGMSLGGRAVQAREVILHRAMPSKEKVTRRRNVAYAYKTRGMPLKHHNVLHKSPVALLIKAARTEQQNNDHLRQLGIDYASHAFSKQLAALPSELLTKKKSRIQASVQTFRDGEAANEAAAPAKSTPTKTASPKAASPPKSASSNKSAPIKTTPKKAVASPKSVSAVKTTPAKCAPNKSAPTKTTPKKAVASPKSVSAVKTTPNKSTPTKSAPAKTTPKKAVASPKSVSAVKTTPAKSAPNKSTPTKTTPAKTASPKAKKSASPSIKVSRGGAKK